ncbi:MAG: M23 family metallopeptidase [Alphaproteobacteria bacterium]|nr:M23 family metallopeptidase [Alphaproteobacteria bacterium]
MMTHFKAIYLICFSLLYAFSANAVELCGQLAQGELIRGKAEGAEQIFLDNTQLNVLKDGTFFFALDRDAPKTATLQIADSDNVDAYPLEITPTDWDIQKINGVPPRKVEPTEKDLHKINIEREDLYRALSYHTNKPLWEKGFVMPVKGRTSGNFGGQRVMNGKPRAPHRGMDIAAPEGTPVYASSDGNVTLSGGNYFYTGNVVVLDHGQNLSTIYAHLKSTTVKKGDKVKQGDIIGYVGQTGRATGPHLHWGASVNNVRFQPLSLLKLDDKSFCSNL